MKDKNGEQHERWISEFYYCDKIPEKIYLKEQILILIHGSQIQGFQNIWSAGSIAWSEAKNIMMHGKRKWTGGVGGSKGPAFFT